MNLPLDGFSYFRSDEPAETQRKLSWLFCTHLFELHGDTANVDARLNAVRLGRVLLLSARLGCEVRLCPGETRPFYVIVIPLAGRGVFFLNGERAEVNPGVGVVVSPDVSLDVFLSADFAAIALRIEEGAIEHAVADRLGFLPPVPVRFDPLMNLTAGPVVDWCDSVLDCVADLDDPASLLLASDDLLRRMDDSLVGTLLAAQPHNYSGFLGDRREPPASRRAVSFVLGLMHHDPRLSLADYARRVGVSVEALHEGFQRRFGIVASAFLRRVRLRRARAHLLLVAGEPAASAREVFLHWKLPYDPGALAEYRQLYGESPEDTLRG
ncbi:AraC-like DNA-binding protein [Prauserella shujinwangii]|uniref:AraC-like DNA-binding protein n=1 Tax=Prauserella shujinwangii TaxID=1453103 RepID=A0A2T0LSF7_9PSEU|nr:AraC family ligand binding domain-containing protein [Prauserella shujinwangii]PRX46545.1 AraC-like DNA-binding protein [Prauserella shujinwangii]